MTFADLQARIASRNAEIEVFCSAHIGVPFQAPTADGFVIVHRDPSNGRWRTSTFDSRGPIGHYFDTCYRDAVRTAMCEFGADLSLAEFASAESMGET